MDQKSASRNISPDPSDPTNLAGAVTWLEEQRRQDREILARLSQDQERSILALRDLATQTSSLRDGLQSVQSRLAQVNMLDDAVKQAREHMTNIQQQLDSIVGQVDQRVSVVQTEGTRYQNLIAELGQEVRETGVKQESLLARVNLFVRDLQSAGAAVSELDRRIEAVGSRIETVAQRLQLTDENVRRGESRIADAERAAAAPRPQEEDPRAVWDQMAEVMWSRWSADTQSRFQAVVEERSSIIEQFARQAQRLSVDIQDLNGKISDEASAREELAKDQKRTESGQRNDHEEVLRLRQVSDGVARKMEEYAFKLKQGDEQLQECLSKTGALEQTLDQYKEQLLSLSAVAVQADEQRVKDIGRITDGQERVRVHLDELSERLADLGRALSAQVDESRASQQRLRKLTEAAWQREIVALQQLLAEAKEV